MAPRQSKTAKRSMTQNKMRTVESEVFPDSHARNLLALQPKMTSKSKIHKPSKAAVKKQQFKTRLYGSNSRKEYCEDELDIPKLNMAVIPGVRPKSGKKGKKFVADNDSLLLTRLVKTISDKYDLVNESKLEKSRRLEEIRDLKRQEIERKEQEKLDKVDSKKKELKKKASLAKANRRKNDKEAQVAQAAQSVNESKPRKAVSFA